MNRSHVYAFLSGLMLASAGFRFVDGDFNFGMACLILGLLQADLCRTEAKVAAVQTGAKV